MQARMKAIVDLFPRGNALVDIGSDHGYLGIELLKAEKTHLVLNVELSKIALKNSHKEYKKLGYEKQARFIYSDGFERIHNLPDNSVVVIAGLGSYQIIRILERAPASVRHVILLSHTDYCPIRRWAKFNGWNIKKEKYVSERKHVYMVMALLRTSSAGDDYSFEDYVLGQRKFREYDSQVFRSYWKSRADKLLKIPYDNRSEEENFVIKTLQKEKIIETYLK